ncbi:hypothetical protein GCM10009118_33540 [Wandonia haliotis]|uniref:Lipoprotein n=1 Tax=Wandonia haliotis TaxID=574963 RepID=A0ABP3Y7Z3_9FLAO
MKKLLFILAVSTFVFASCKKEVITPVSVEENSDEATEMTTRSLQGSGSTNTGGDLFGGTGITDPNNDTDEDKRKREGK